MKNHSARSQTKEHKLDVVRDSHLAEDIDRIKADLFQALSEKAKASNELTGAQHTFTSLEQQVLQLTQEQAVKAKERQSLGDTLQDQEKELAQVEQQALLRDREMLTLRTERDQLKGTTTRTIR